MHRALLVFLSLTFSSLLFAAADGATPPPEKDDEVISPTYSAQGRKHLEKNKTIIDQNIKDLEQNLATTDKNIKTLQDELKDLNGLEKEHDELHTKYTDYLAKADREIAKNEAATRKLDEFEKEVKSNSHSGVDQQQQHSEMEKARLDRADRTKWKADAQAKVKRINEMLKGLKENVGSIHSRRSNLQAQVKSWTERRKEFERVLATMKEKRNTLDKLAKSK